MPAVRRIKAADLRDVLVRGLGDFGAYRTDVIFLGLIYPLVGIVLAWLTVVDAEDLLIAALKAGHMLMSEKG